MLNLHIGCGDVYFDGWVNIDIDSAKADLLFDIRQPFPYENNSVDFIYNEHLIEHLKVQEGLAVLKECYRVLKPCGVLRIATLDLDYVIFKYIFGWKKQAWIKDYGYEWLQTRAEMINLCFHEWGHQYLYNFEELARRLKETGFHKNKREKLNRSRFSELKNKETRKDSKLIVEAIK